MAKQKKNNSTTTSTAAEATAALERVLSEMNPNYAERVGAPGEVPAALDPLPFAPQGAVVDLRLDQLVEHPKNQEIYAETSRDEDMVRSIKSNGVLQPLLVRFLPISADQKFYEIVSGHRRAFNARLAGLDAVPCVVKSYISEAEIESDLLESNRQRIKSRRELKNEFLAAKQIARQIIKERVKSGRSVDGKLGKLSPGTIVPGQEREREIIAESLGLSERQVKEKTIVYDDEYLQKQLDKWNKNPSWTIDAETEIFEKWCHVRSLCDDGVVTDSAGAKQIKTLIADVEKQLADASQLPGAKKKKTAPQPPAAKNLLVGVELVFAEDMFDGLSVAQIKDVVFDYVAALGKFMNKGRYSINAGQAYAGRVALAVKEK